MCFILSLAYYGFDTGIFSINCRKNTYIKFFSDCNDNSIHIRKTESIHCFCIPYIDSNCTGDKVGNRVDTLFIYINSENIGTCICKFDGNASSKFSKSDNGK